MFCINFVLNIFDARSDRPKQKSYESVLLSVDRFLV
jgi:hypothetical protein